MAQREVRRLLPSYWDDLVAIHNHYTTQEILLALVELEAELNGETIAIKRLREFANHWFREDNQWPKA